MPWGVPLPGGGGGSSFADLLAELAGSPMSPGQAIVKGGKQAAAGGGVKKAVGSTAGSIGGTALGTAVGGPVGGAIGGTLGSGIGRAISGMFGGGKKEPRWDIPMMEPTERIDPGFLSALLQGGFGDEMPGYATGTPFQPGGPALVGELGPELAMLAPGPVIPMGREMAQFSPTDYVEEPAQQMGQDSGFFAEIARALGANPFGEEGSLGGLTEAITGALPGRHHTAGRIGVEGLGALGNILTNRELVDQGEVEKLNASLRERAKQRNEDLRTRAKEERATAGRVAETRAKGEADTASKAAERRFILSDKVSDKIGLPRGERVTFDEYTKALDAAKPKLPTNEFDRVLAASPAEWSTYVKRKGEVATAENAAKPKDAKPPTAEQSKAASFHNRALKAVERIAKIDKSGSTIEDRIASQNPIAATAGQRLPNTMKGADRQQYEQAVGAFALAVLRKESGAAISKSEFDGVAQKFFVQPGDGPDVIAQKKADRDAVIEGLKSESGAAGARFDTGNAALSDDEAYQEYLSVVGAR